MSVPTPRMAAGNSFDCQPAPLECAIFAYGFQSILRTGRSIAASWRNHRTDAVLVKLDQPLQQLGNHNFCNSSRWSCARISSAPSRPKGRRTRIIKSRGGTAPYAVETSRATHVSYNCDHGHVWLFFYRPPNQAAHARRDWHRNKKFAVTRSYIAFLKQKRKKILPFSISGTACRSFPKRLRIKRPNAYGLWRGAQPIRHGRRGFWSAPKSRGCVCVWLRKVDKCVS